MFGLTSRILERGRLPGTIRFNLHFSVREMRVHFLYVIRLLRRRSIVRAVILCLETQGGVIGVVGVTARRAIRIGVLANMRTPARLNVV